MLNFTGVFPLPVQARLAGRPFWEARYHDGREINERELDWSLLPRKGLIELRLYCPNGQVAVLGNSKDASDRLFQFKMATASTEGNFTDAQVIGLLADTKGTAQCWAWEMLEQRLLKFETSYPTFVYPDGTIHQLSQNVLGAKVD